VASVGILLLRRLRGCGRIRKEEGEMPQEKNAFSSIQKELLVPAFEEIVAFLKEHSIRATMSSTDDSREVNFVGKNGKQCAYRCWIGAEERPRIYEYVRNPATDHGLTLEDFSGVFASDIKPETIVMAFKRHFRFHV
jgi:hypothetical protein